MKTVEVAGDKTVTNFQNHNYIQHLKKEDKNWKEIIKYKSNKVVWVNECFWLFLLIVL